MKILVLCEQGNNRSVTLAWVLKYAGHDVLTAGVQTNKRQTVKMLFDWADKVIITEAGQLPLGHPKLELWDVGPDRYPRPFNPQLLAICRRLYAEHAEASKL